MKSSPPNQDRKIRVALCGNICNNLYQIAKILRRHSNIDAHLFLEETDDFQQLPESDDPQLLGDYPAWIHKGRFSLRMSRLAPWLSPLVKELKTYDIAIVSGLGPMFASFVKKPFVFWTSGADFTVYPFPFDYRTFHPTWKSKVWSWITGFWQRLGIRHQLEIWTQPFAPFIYSSQKLKLPDHLISRSYFPAVIDAEVIKRNTKIRSHDSEPARQMMDRFDFVIFHPTRFMMRKTSVLLNSGQWKRNEVLLLGFSEFIKRPDVKRAGLVFIDRAPSPDREMGKKLVSELKLDDHALWLKPSRPCGFTRSELIDLYSMSDVVADEFGIGWFGNVVLEACATECAVLAYIDEAVMKTLYPWHPLLSAQSPEEVAAHLYRLYKNPTEVTRLGLLGRQWVNEFHSGAQAAKIYQPHIERIVQSSRHST